MSGHTPGPWQAAIEDGRHAVIASIAGEPKAVAIVANNTPHDGKQETRFANARLIAAAPTLLEALLYIEGLALANDWRDLPTIAQAARNAIAKAEGSR